MRRASSGREISKPACGDQSLRDSVVARRACRASSQRRPGADAAAVDECSRRTVEAVVARGDDERRALSGVGRCRGKGDATVRVDDVGSPGLDEPAKLPGRDGIGKRGMVELAAPCQCGDRRPKLAKPVDGNSVVELFRRGSGVPQRRHGDVMTALGEFVCQEPSLAMRTADEGWIVVARDQHAHGAMPSSRRRSSDCAGDAAPAVVPGGSWLLPRAHPRVPVGVSPLPCESRPCESTRTFLARSPRPRCRRPSGPRPRVRRPSGRLARRRPVREPLQTAGFDARRPVRS